MVTFGQMCIFMSMRSALKSAVLLMCLLPFLAQAQFTARTKTSLILPAETVKPGDTIVAGVHLQMPEGWHTYWKNSGASGIPTKINWQLPAGVTAGEILWPLPEKTPDGDLTTYVYEGDVLLLVPLTFAPDLNQKTVDLKAHVSWLECKESCIPGKADISAALAVGNALKVSTNANVIETWQKKLPESISTSDLSPTARWNGPATGDSRSLKIELTNAHGNNIDFFPQASEQFEVQPATEVVSADGGKIELRKSVKKYLGDWPNEISGVLVVENPTDHSRTGYDVTLQIGASAAAPVAATTGGKSLGLMLLYAFLGGLILNIMPCVFPVIALKILGFVQQSRDSRSHIFRHGLLYAGGVVISFLVLAGAVIAAQHAGGAASWGMQLQNRAFTLALTVLTLLVALNLFGLFEVTLHAHVMSRADKLAAQEGVAGTFFNGVLATLLATPCTAPFLAPALGFAFTQPSLIIVLMFLAVALGLAFPYILLSWEPQWLRFLPRPGIWMEKFKMAMGFPMLATTVWLFSFNSKRFGTGGPLRIGLFLVAIAMAIWVWGQFVQQGRKRKVLAGFFAVALVMVGSVFGFLHEDAAWQKWSAQAVQQARVAGHPVLVDFTADWCTTCQWNKRVAIDVASVQNKLRDINAVTLIGDNTDEDPAIIAELQKHERAGVPLVLVYPSNTNRSPIVLPPLLTASIVLDALDEAAK